MAANEVHGVRELVVHQPPPDAPDWIAGIAITEVAAVVVAAVDDRCAPSTEPQRVVVLRTSTEAGAARCGLLVDEVVELRELDAGAPAAAAGARDWLRQRPEGCLVDVAALTAAMLAGGPA
ncbi:MAG: hypothetical protein MUC36_02305 [Planctomycetes bacterium]|nr:hypothetical protein [Planctomycetota bacterium]